MPKTSYLKLIDIWFLFCIMIDFVMMTMLVVINNILESSIAPSKPITPAATFVKVNAFENVSLVGAV